MKYYVISDTHYEHTNIIDFCGRPENYEELLFNNTMALPEDSVLLHLGDVCIGDDARVHENYIQPLKCKKILVKGNHDSKSYKWYMEHGWDFVCNSFTLYYGGKDLLFTHRPEAWDGHWTLNIHGHLHNLGHRSTERATLKPWQKLYSAEDENYKPVELTKFI